MTLQEAKHLLKRSVVNEVYDLCEEYDITVDNLISLLETDYGDANNKSYDRMTGDIRKLIYNTKGDAVRGLPTEISKRTKLYKKVNPRYVYYFAINILKNKIDNLPEKLQRSNYAKALQSVVDSLNKKKLGTTTAKAEKRREKKGRKIIKKSERRPKK